MVDVGPSPVIPFLMVVTLWYIIYGHSSVSELENMSIDFLIIPILVLLLLVFFTQSIIVPLMLILVVYMVSTTLLGPLILILLVYVFGTGVFGNGGGRRRYDDDDDDYGYEWDANYGNVGCGFILFIVMFIVLLGMFSEGEGYDWGTALLVIIIFTLFNLFCF